MPLDTSDDGAIQQSRYDEVFSDQDEIFKAASPVLEQSTFSEKRFHAINEFISTEKDYLEALEIVRDHFIGPLQGQQILADDERQIIFINWNDLLLCTKRLYKSLKIRRKMNNKADINIGDILCENVISQVISNSFFSGC